MNFKYITIVHIDGRESDYLDGQNAIIKSMEQLPGSRGLLLSPHKPKTLFNEIEHKEIPKLGYYDYSLFMIYALHHYISTEFVITVQDDGWVLNGSAWNESFLDCDFIGAPIHLAKITNLDKTSKTLNRFRWTEFIDTDSKIENVFNGGFSIRSKQFLEAPARYNIQYKLSAPIGLGTYPKILMWEDECNQEDVQLCLYMRPDLEKIGIKFPNIKLAKYFSFEHLTPKLHQDINLNSVLGHHASIRKLKNNRIKYNLYENEIQTIYGEDRVVQLFKSAGYELDFLDKYNYNL